MTNSRKTLIILSPGFAANEADSTCLPSQQQLVKTLTEDFPLVNIIVLAFQYPFTDRPYRWHNATVIPFNGQNKGKANRLAIWIKVWRRLTVLKKQNEVIGLLSFWYGECALIGKLFGKRNLIKHVTWLLGQDARPGNKIARLMKPGRKELVALSDFVAREFKKNYKVKPANTIPIGIDTRLYSQKKVMRDIDVLGVGSLIPLKQYDTFIEVIKALRADFPGIQAMICGKGEEEEKLKSMILRDSLQDSITMAGEKSHAEVLQVMQRSKLFLHTSSYEGFGVVCLEALYAGAHVISFVDPKDAVIKNWHIVKDAGEMIGLAGELLHNHSPDHSPVLVYTMKDTAKSIIQLFDHNPAAIS